MKRLLKIFFRLIIGLILVLTIVLAGGVLYFNVILGPAERTETVRHFMAQQSGLDIQFTDVVLSFQGFLRFKDFRLDYPFRDKSSLHLNAETAELHFNFASLRRKQFMIEALSLRDFNITALSPSGRSNLDGPDLEILFSPHFNPSLFSFGEFPSAEITFQDLNFSTKALKTPIINVNGQILTSSKNILLENLEGTWQGHAWTGNAGVYFENLLSITGDISLSSLDGMGNVVATFSGQRGLADIPGWTFEGNIESLEVTVAPVVVKEFKALFTYSDHVLEIPRFTGTIFDGHSEGSLALNISSPTPQIHLVWLSRSMDLNKLLNAFSKKNEKFTGNLDLGLEFDGPINDPENLKGIGSLALTDGRLWKLPVFRGLPILSSVPILGSSHITDGNGSFVIQNRKISTEDLVFQGMTAEVKIRGSVDFDKNLDLYVDTKTIRKAIAKIPFLSSVMEAVQNLGVIPVIHVTGTIEKPEYNPVFPQTAPDAR